MTGPDEDPPPYDPPEVHCRHLIVCRSMWYSADADDGYSLGRLVVTVRPDAGQGFGFVIPRLFAFAQLFGTPGTYAVCIWLVPVDVGEDGESQGPPVRWGPWEFEVTGFELVESRGFVLEEVPFERPGVYEFQLRLDGDDEPVGRERVEARDDIRE
jgi:hypothetical protein